MVLKNGKPLINMGLRPMLFILWPNIRSRSVSVYSGLSSGTLGSHSGLVCSHSGWGLLSGCVCLYSGYVVFKGKPINMGLKPMSFISWLYIRSSGVYAHSGLGSGSLGSILW